MLIRDLLLDYIVWIYRIFHQYPKSVCDMNYDLWNEWSLLFVKDDTGSLVDWSLMKPNTDYMLTIENKKTKQIVYLPIFREEIEFIFDTKGMKPIHIHQIILEVMRTRVQNMIYDFDLNDQLLDTEYGSLYGREMQYFIPYFNDLGVTNRLNLMKTITWW